MLLKVCIRTHACIVITDACIYICVYSYIYAFTGFRKKLDKQGKQKDCEIVAEWKKSIINHLYWCVSSTTSADVELIKAKWLSLDNHIHNIHRKHGKKFSKCTHGRLRRQDRNKKWLQRRKCHIPLQHKCKCIKLYRY